MQKQKDVFGLWQSEHCSEVAGKKKVFFAKLVRLGKSGRALFSVGLYKNVLMTLHKKKCRTSESEILRGSL